MTTVVLVAGTLCGLAALVWLTIGRTLLKAAPAASELAVGPGLLLLDDPAALLEGVRIGEVVRWLDDLLVGFDNGRGSWTHPDHSPTRVGVHIVGDQYSASGQMHVALGARNQRTRRLLSKWQSGSCALTAVLTRDGTFAIVDLSSRDALLGEVLPAA